MIILAAFALALGLYQLYVETPKKSAGSLGLVLLSIAILLEPIKALIR